MKYYRLLSSPRDRALFRRRVRVYVRMRLRDLGPNARVSEILPEYLVNFLDMVQVDDHDTAIAYFMLAFNAVWYEFRLTTQCTT